jgi:metalloendopeptidase OMA1, mitochondrial
MDTHPFAVARHAAERYSYSKILIAMAGLADAIGLPSGVGGIITTLLMDLPHSRKQEYEGLCLYLLISRKYYALTEVVHVADKIGLNLSAKACFDPTAAPECVLFRLDLFISHAGTTQDVQAP